MSNVTSQNHVWPADSLSFTSNDSATVLLPCRAGRGVWGEFDVTPASGGHASALGGFVWRSGSQAPWRYPRDVLSERDVKGV
jgi:hypothetical protein